MDLQKDYTYIAYKDKAGYIATATQATQAGEFVLLTDAYYATTKAGADYAVKAYVDGEIGSYDVNARSTANFIAKGSDNNNWGKLNKFQCKSEDTETHLTNVATYTLDDDGVMSLNVVEKAFNKKVVNMIDLDVVTLNGTNKKLSGANYYTASTDTTPYATKDKGSQTVNVRSDTVYYYVSKDAVTDTITVKSYTGYANAPQVAAADINNMYAVATYVTSSDYWVANVVVVELKDSYKGSAESVFVYNYPENVNTLRNATIDIIKADGTTASVNVANPSEITYGPAYLYGNATDGYIIKKMDTTDFADNKLLAGKVTTEAEVKVADYVGITGVYDNGDPYATETRLGDTSGVYYTYSITNNGKYNVGSLVASDADTVLVSKVDVTTDAKGTVSKDQANLVFVSYDAKGNIIYAISFNQDYAKGVKTADTAAKVWEGLRVAKTSDSYTGTLVVTDGTDPVTGVTFKVDENAATKISTSNSSVKLVVTLPTGYELSDDPEFEVADTDTAPEIAQYTTQDGTLSYVLTGIKNDFTLTFTVERSEYAVKQGSNTTYKASGASQSLSALTGNYYTITDDAGKYYDSDGSCKDSTATYIAVATTSITQPAADVTITDGYYKITIDTSTYEYAQNGTYTIQTSLTGNYYTADDGTSYVEKTNKAVTVDSADVTVTSGYYKVTVDGEVAGYDKNGGSGVSVTMKGSSYTDDNKTSFKTNVENVTVSDADVTITSGFWAVTISAGAKVDGTDYRVSGGTKCESTYYVADNESLSVTPTTGNSFTYNGTKYNGTNGSASVLINADGTLTLTFED
jgi:hypothetical protein